MPTLFTNWKQDGARVDLEGLGSTVIPKEESALGSKVVALNRWSRCRVRDRFGDEIYNCWRGERNLGALCFLSFTTGDHVYISAHGSTGGRHMRASFLVNSFGFMISFSAASGYSGSGLVTGRDNLLRLSFHAMGTPNWSRLLGSVGSSSEDRDVFSSQLFLPENLLWGKFDVFLIKFLSTGANQGKYDRGLKCCRCWNGVIIVMN